MHSHALGATHPTESSQPPRCQVRVRHRRFWKSVLLEANPTAASDIVSYRHGVWCMVGVVARGESGGSQTHAFVFSDLPMVESSERTKALHSAGLSQQAWHKQLQLFCRTFFSVFIIRFNYFPAHELFYPGPILKRWISC